MQRKRFLRLAGITLGGIALAPVLTACGGGDEAAIDASVPVLDRTALEPLQGEELSAEEIAGLLFMREEEKLAHDVYVALYGLWGAQVFSNIVPSEAQHTEAVRQLILAHGLADPAATTPPGVFVNAELQRLYDQLVAMGQPSLIDALKVGCLVEEKDIVDIEEKKREVLDEPDIVAVYDNLLCGSRNHLRAFNRALETAGGVYDQPQFLSLDEWTAIAGSAPELCGA
ncbi:MAG: DUF2202 domain-containing protein [Hydrogenophaga sp.]|uniref:DUF2202 domain-containing protein n=1 Tax=Hydrogenophaga sp. TaxID=1904254 RepID=UPI002636A0F0|nr:DUF2202 domain-containing protein [Hydrogenophaga sp.]MDM7944063.1 DUF2202 domain-containing protein [Hydrogenophaga sp.]